jgi:phosphoribosylanthranilate isomerase
MVGVLVSGKTLKGLPNKYPRRYPKPAHIQNIFTSHPDVLNLIHYSTDEPEVLMDEMFRAQEAAGQNCHGFQLNVPWPAKKTLMSYKKAAFFTSKVIVLQCGKQALLQCDFSANKIAKRVKEYDGLIDYVLVDPSGGLGHRFDTPFARRCFEELEKLSTLGFGIAGGLKVDNLRRLQPLIRQFSDFSIDAESGLRDQDDNLDTETAGAYLKEAYAEFRRRH